ncbi:MAG: hypothetical protein HY558_04150 [Euryarchaeota archaeon]|nr:hypothetical protein [Euryarchaeota archaeon]
MVALISLAVLLGLSLATYGALTRAIPLRVSQEMFLEMYVPEAERRHRKFTAAFLLFKAALVLGFFRAYAWVIESIERVFRLDVADSADLLEESSAALGGAYGLLLAGTLIILPYIRRRLRERQQASGKKA